MDLQFFLPTKVILGEGCIEKNSALFSELGKRAVIVTYPVSRQNGSLRDVTAALDKAGVAWEVMEDAPVNPELGAVAEMGRRAREFRADIVVGIGGGSAMDAAKAVAALAANDMPPMELFSNRFERPPLPVVTVPTTAGTGAEVTANAVLTIREQNVKKSFGIEPLTSPRCAFLDARYTQTLPAQIALDTAVDALSHGIEGYLRSGGTYVTDMLGEAIFAIFRESRAALEAGELNLERRERLLYMAMLSGVMINHARTLAVHAMGYALTLGRGLSHGAACGILLGDFVAFCRPACQAKVDAMLRSLGLTDTGELTAMLKGMLHQSIAYTREELARYTQETWKAAAAKPNPRPMEEGDVLALFEAALLS